MTILQPTNLHSSSINYLAHAFKTKTNSSTLSTKKLQVITTDETAPFVLTLLQNNQLSRLDHLDIAISTNYHRTLYQALSNNSLIIGLKHFSIHDLADDGFIMSPEKDHMLLFKFLSNILSKSQSTLKTLDISSFPSNILVQCNDYQFPHVTSLSIALIDDHNPKYWKQLKRMFPNLIELRLNLPIRNLALFRSLLSDLSLFPWVKRLSVQSRECPKNYLSREELRTSLLQLNGLNRITAGWDMIALNWNPLPPPLYT